MPATNNNSEIQFRCTIRYMFKGCPKQDGWFGCFAQVKGGASIRLTGKTLLPLTKGMQLDVTASKVSDDEFAASSITVVTRTLTGTKSYLKSLHGVSDAVADKLVKTFGTNAIELIRTDPDKVKSQLGLQTQQMNALTKGVTNTDEVNQLRTFLPELYTDAINHIKNTMQPNPIDQIKANPWILMNCPHTSFQVVDTIAVRLGTSPFAMDRIERGILHTIQSEQNGDSYINLSDDNAMLSLMVKVQTLLRIKFGQGMAEFGSILMNMSNAKEPTIHIEQYGNEFHLYTIEDWNDYGLVLEHLNHNRQGLYLQTKMETDALRKVMSQQELILPFTLTDEQRYASIIALSRRLSVITGGPGRGKTLTIGYIAACNGDLTNELVKNSVTSAISLHQNPVLLLAPTGRAAKKLQTDTHDKYQTMTIDRLLCAVEFEQRAEDNNKKKKKSKGYFSSFNKPATLIIVDESSMVDIPKIAALFRYFGEARFCFVGDKDQLPPVGKGQFFHDIIRSGKITVAELTIPMRNGGLILSNADKINAKDTNLQYDIHEMPLYPQEEDNQDMLDFIIDQYNDERTLEPDTSQIAIICPVQKGTIGVININIAFQEIICPENDACVASFNAQRKTSIFTTKGYQIPDTFYGQSGNYTRFRVGDTVMCTKTNYNIRLTEYDQNDYWNGKETGSSNGIFNGDVGRIIGYIPDHAVGNDTDSDFIIVQFNDGRVAELDRSQEEFDNFVLGYAMTVHKVQGCEYNTVVYVSPKRLMSMTAIGFACKNLAYTAITRAKKRVVIIGSKESLNTCIQTDMSHRNSTLAESII